MDLLDIQVHAFGEEKSLFEWSKDRRSVVSHLTLASRLEAGWQPERAITTPAVKSIRQLEKLVSAFGESKSLLDWATDSRAQVPSRTILWRLRRGWSAEDAITQGISPAVLPARKSPPKPPQLFEAFGVKNTLRGWLEDPRCTVKREKLLRSLGQGLSMEEALTSSGEDGRKKRSRPIVERAVEDLQEAIKILASGAELWHAQTPGSARSSLLKGNTRYELSSDLVEALINGGYVEVVFETPTITEYRVSELGRKAAL